MSFKRVKDGNYAAPPEVAQAVIHLALACAKHNLILEQLPEAHVIAKQAAIIKQQREIIRKLEERLGIDDDL